jgi:hypothetical protein
MSLLGCVFSFCMECGGSGSLTSVNFLVTFTTHSSMHAPCKGFYISLMIWKSLQTSTHPFSVFPTARPEDSVQLNLQLPRAFVSDRQGLRVECLSELLGHLRRLSHFDKIFVALRSCLTSNKSCTSIITTINCRGSRTLNALCDVR